MVNYWYNSVYFFHLFVSVSSFLLTRKVLAYFLFSIETIEILRNELQCAKDIILCAHVELDLLKNWETIFYGKWDSFERFIFCANWWSRNWKDNFKFQQWGKNCKRFLELFFVGFLNNLYVLLSVTKNHINLLSYLSHCIHAAKLDIWPKLQTKMLPISSATQKKTIQKNSQSWKKMQSSQKISQTVLWQHHFQQFSQQSMPCTQQSRIISL